VVISKIPPHCLALENPAEAFIKNFGLPTDIKKRNKAAEAVHPCELV